MFLDPYEELRVSGRRHRVLVFTLLNTADSRQNLAIPSVWIPNEGYASGGLENKKDYSSRKIHVVRAADTESTSCRWFGLGGDVFCHEHMERSCAVGYLMLDGL